MRERQFLCMYFQNLNKVQIWMGRWVVYGKSASIFVYVFSKFEQSSDLDGYVGGLRKVSRSDFKIEKYTYTLLLLKASMVCMPRSFQK